MAAPLTRYLHEKGAYDGLDIVKQGVDWCNKHIHRRHPNFNFHHADIYNKQYNPNGKLRATDFRFPFPDDSYDFVFLTSVFTHILVDDVEHYTDEIRRV